MFRAGALYFYCFFLCIFCKSCTHEHRARSGKITVPKNRICSTTRDHENVCVGSSCSVASSRYGLVCCFLLWLRRVCKIKGRRAGREETRSLYFPPNFLTFCVSGRRRCRSVMFWPRSLSRNGRSFCLQIPPPPHFLYIHAVLRYWRLSFRSARLPERYALGHDFTQHVWLGLSWGCGCSSLGWVSAVFC